ncbi:twin-arginine translocase subunit TatC [Lysinibacter sp. HNR]|uniref:twin-arginine translocase subunit TatC n=1 Tax=Lysinibacter sp. HNR TaxID=3031408 RepID=UPI0024349290|nr:twin-arginine translocase subunit TatC [Lysinibacter sp. HNR]WGD36221.1 twin-arginine translocase subunit TatC [Lysinibacter sp. HNR]
MSLREHLLELRKRLFRAALGVVAGTIIGWVLSGFVLNALRGPVQQIALTQGRQAELNYTDITGAFDLKLQIAFTVGIVLSSPVWLYQIWRFFAPALSGQEKKYTTIFLSAAIPLFLAGCYAGWFVFPNIVNLMTGFAPAEDTAFINARQYYDFALRLVVVVGIGFMVPVILVLLNFVGVLSARSILKSWRIAILVITLFTAIATPAADVISMFMLAIPMVFLYFLAAGIAYLRDRRFVKKQAKLLDEREAELPA